MTRMVRLESAYTPFAHGRLLQSSATRRIVLPGMRLSGANAAAASASGSTAPTTGLRRPSRTRAARSASRARSASTRKNSCPPVARLGLRRLGDGDERSAGAHQCGRAGENVSADHVEHHVDFPCVLQLFGLQVEEGMDAEREARSRSAVRPVPMTRAPTSRASCTAIDPTPPAAPWIRTVCPVARRP